MKGGTSVYVVLSWGTVPCEAAAQSPRKRDPKRPNEVEEDLQQELRTLSWQE